MFPTCNRRSWLLVAVLVLMGIGSSLCLQEVAPAAPSPAEEAALARAQTPADADADADAEYEFLKRLNDFNVGKRAYSYVSEYKRLPVYNFGLGKRAPSQLYGFGLGKRAPGNRLYSFGLGKRDYEEDYSDEGDEGDISEEDTNQDMAADKRNRLYSFGLGKRMSPYSFGLGKRSSGDARRLYSFGLGKRASPSMYSFGLGKRADTRLYSFGLGKRPSSNRNTRFSFGLGKRSGEGFDDDADLEEAKRYAAPDHRFSFGLGKREVSSTDLEEVSKEEGKDKHSKDHAIAKRSLHYAFGLGKRSPLDYQNEKEQYGDVEDLTRYARRPYSFGLGKRIPMYGFGIGKRAEG